MAMYPFAADLNSFYEITFYTLLSCSFLYQFKKLGYIGSDLYPTYVELVLEPENKQDYKGLAPDGRDIETAGEKVKRAMES